MSEPLYLMPTWGFGISKGPDGKHQVFLEIGTGYTQHQFYLTDAKGYQDVAGKFHEGIIAAGKEAAHLDSGLVVLNGSEQDNATIIRATERQQRGTRRKGS